MEYITNSNCVCCGDKLTIDDVNFYGEYCFKCCSKIHSIYEKAHCGLGDTDHNRIAISKKLKDYIFSRDKKCLKCGSLDNLTIDHVIPVSFGGSNGHDNLQCLCRECNSIKSNYPLDYREVIE